MFTLLLVFPMIYVLSISECLFLVRLSSPGGGVCKVTLTPKSVAVK